MHHSANYGFLFDAINGTNVSVIYLQPPQFSVSSSACVDHSRSTTTGSRVTKTITITVDSPATTSGQCGSMMTTLAPTTVTAPADACPVLVIMNPYRCIDMVALADSIDPLYRDGTGITRPLPYFGVVGDEEPAGYGESCLLRFDM